jgi:coenzyme PQQ precursor peptide PqqA
MTWEAPDFVEVKMDAEINSYQDDFGVRAGRPLLSD